MLILAASSGIVMPGCPVTNDSACAARVPLPLRRPARRGEAAVAVLAAGVAVLAAAALGGRPRRAPVVRLLEPRGRPGPRLAGAAAVAAAGAAAVARGAEPR